jgi:hypothetical protein
MTKHSKEEVTHLDNMAKKKRKNLNMRPVNGEAKAKYSYGF